MHIYYNMCNNLRIGCHCNRRISPYIVVCVIYPQLHEYELIYRAKVRASQHPPKRMQQQ